MTTAETYHAGVAALEDAERAYLAAVDTLERAARDPRTLDQARRSCEAREIALAGALETAWNAHRRYWQGRRDELLDELEMAAGVISDYNALARAAGDLSASPAMQVLQGLLSKRSPGSPLVDEEVPADPPDSAALEDFRGCWRRP